MSDQKKKHYLVDVVFKTPIEGQGVVRAESEEEAINTTLEVYKDQEDVHIISIDEIPEDIKEEDFQEYLDNLGLEETVEVPTSTKTLH